MKFLVNWTSLRVFNMSGQMKTYSD